MRLEITDHRKIFAIQKEFNQEFPNLKIEFYARPHTGDGPPSKKLIHHPAKTLGTCRTIHRKGFLTILREMTVEDLLRSMRDAYGLSAKISRRLERMDRDFRHRRVDAGKAE